MGVSDILAKIYVYVPPLCFLFLAVLILLLLLHVQQFRLDSSTHGNHHSTRVMSVYPLLDFRQPETNRQRVEFFWMLTKNVTADAHTQKANLPLVLFSDVIFLWEINKVDHGLGCQKQVFVQHINLWRKCKRVQIMFSSQFTEFLQWDPAIEIMCTLWPESPWTYWWCNGQTTQSIKKQVTTTVKAKLHQYWYNYVLFKFAN